MEFVRRATLTGLMLAVAAPGLTQDAAPPLRLRAARAASGLIIENAGARPMLIERTIGVEKLVGTRWMAVGTEMKAINACAANRMAGPVRLPPRTSLSVVPWRGASCSGQCNYTCRANIDYPPGRFRFVVTTLSNQARVTGPAFQLDQPIL